MDQEPNIPFWGWYKDHSPKDSFFENLLSISGTSSDPEAFAYFKPEDYINDINHHFKKFLKGCLWNFNSRKEDPIGTYNYLKYILNRFRIHKGVMFSERGGIIMHTLLPDPISKGSEGMHKSVYYLYERINEAISILEDYIKQLTPKDEIKDNEITRQRIGKPRLHGFRIKKRDCLNTVFNRLIFNRLIHQNVSFKDFERAFTDWIPDNKIIWQEGPGLLSYFIKSINGKGIEDEKKSIWTTTTNCFQDKNSKDFTIEQLRFAKKPSKTDDVDLVIKVVNRNQEI